jgi:hypothetical protein
MIYETMVFAIGIGAGLLCHELNVQRGHGAVKSACIVGLMFGLAFYFATLLMSGVGFGTDAMNAVRAIPAVAIGAAFAGMSSKAVMTNRKWMLLTGALFSLVYLLSNGLFNGNGGVLGATASLAVVMMLGIKKLARSKDMLQPV